MIQARRVSPGLLHHLGRQPLVDDGKDEVS